MDFVKAVETLCGERGAAVRMPSDIPHKEKPAKPFLLPPENRCGTAAVSYLLGRGIDGEVISQCIRKGILYESRNYHGEPSRPGKGNGSLSSPPPASLTVMLRKAHQ